MTISDEARKSIARVLAQSLLDQGSLLSNKQLTQLCETLADALVISPDVTVTDEEEQQNVIDWREEARRQKLIAQALWRKLYKIQDVVNIGVGPVDVAAIHEILEA